MFDDLCKTIHPFFNRQSFQKRNGKTTLEYSLQPFLSMHLDTRFFASNGLSNWSDAGYSYILSGLAILILIIACINFINIALARSMQRSKEIGIRKVLGASIANIAVMLSRDFLALIVVAIIIASPVAWYFAHQWLQDFTYKTSISWWIFGLAGICAILIAIVTISYQAIKAAMANPVKSLRSE